MQTKSTLPQDNRFFTDGLALAPPFTLVSTGLSFEGGPCTPGGGLPFTGGGGNCCGKRGSTGKEGLARGAPNDGETLCKLMAGYSACIGLAGGCTPRGLISLVAKKGSRGTGGEVGALPNDGPRGLPNVE